jgi:hypothetical protein
VEHKLSSACFELFRLQSFWAWCSLSPSHLAVVGEKYHAFLLQATQIYPGQPCAVILVGSQKEFNQAKLSNYSFSKAIAITTYSGLFNTNPKFDDSHTIILDDAHSAESYIANLWTVTIDRLSSLKLYASIVEMLSGSLPEQYLQDMLVSDTRPSFVVRRDIECVPMPLLYEKLSSLRDYLDENIDEDNKWSWSMIRNNLAAYQFYVTWRAITIRPMIPPTFTHAAFSNAKQRVYVSATLGEGGELERSIGITSIDALPIPEGWDKQTTGRRFVLFPNTALLVLQRKVESKNRVT